MIYLRLAERSNGHRPQANRALERVMLTDAQQATLLAESEAFLKQRKSLKELADKYRVKPDVIWRMRYNAKRGRKKKG